MKSCSSEALNCRVVVVVAWTRPYIRHQGPFWHAVTVEPEAVWGLEGSPSGMVHYLKLHMLRQAGSPTLPTAKVFPLFVSFLCTV